jgi:hypothetical protein
VSKNDTIGSAAFLNQIAIDAVEELEPIVDEVLDTLLPDGVPPGAEPVTLRSLRDMPIQEAVAELAAMVRNPATQKRALHLSGQYMDALAAKFEQLGETDGA